MLSAGFLSDAQPSTLFKKTKNKNRSVYSAPPGCKAAHKRQPYPCLRVAWTTVGCRDSRCGGVSSPPQRMSLEHLFVLQQSAPSPPHPTSPICAPPRPPPRGTSKRTSAAPVLIWDKWDLCSTKGADALRRISRPPPHTHAHLGLIPSAPDLHAWNECL